MIWRAVIATAKLTAFRRVDAPETDQRSVNFQRIAVDDTGLPNQIIGERYAVAIRANAAIQMFEFLMACMLLV